MTEIETLKNRIKELEAENSELWEKADFLDCLEAAGVDNWQGYSIAQDMMEEEE